jgi:hypothetical protein
LIFLAHQQGHKVSTIAAVEVFASTRREGRPGWTEAWRVLGSMVVAWVTS